MARRSRLLLAVALGLVGFLAVIAVRGRPGQSANRLPRKFQLAGLIQPEQHTTADLRSQVAHLRQHADGLLRTAAFPPAAPSSSEQKVATAPFAAALDAV